MKLWVHILLSKKECHAMQKYRRILRRRAILSLIDGVVIFLILLVLLVASNLVPTGRTISYSNAPGHILVQLAEFPGLAGAKMHTAQEWTLYGDGTLVFRSDPGDDLWRAGQTRGPSICRRRVCLPSKSSCLPIIPCMLCIVPPIPIPTATMGIDSGKPGAPCGNLAPARGATTFLPLKIKGNKALAWLCFVRRLTDPGTCLALQFRHYLLHLQGNDGRQLGLLLVHGPLETTEIFMHLPLQLLPPCPRQGEKWSLVALLFLYSIHLKQLPQ